jgi:uncharacterized membrane protein YhhN
VTIGFAAPPAALFAAGASFALSLALVICEWRGWKRGCAVSKILASSGFVAAAWLAGAAATSYGRWILVALALSWVGDVLLLARREAPFLAGMGAFLGAHVVFALAFAALPLSWPALSVALPLLVVFAATTLRWLWPHARGPMRVALPAYVVAIVAMCVLAVAAGVGSGVALIAVGALAFAVSDVAVARDRFVAPGWGNRAWGLPLYYAAQLAIGFSVLAVPA